MRIAAGCVGRRGLMGAQRGRAIGAKARPRRESAAAHGRQNGTGEAGLGRLLPVKLRRSRGAFHGRRCLKRPLAVPMRCMMEG